MRRIVIKLGSSVVGDERGALRASALGPIADTVAAQRREGRELVVVSSGAIACGIGIMGLSARPTAIAELQAASAVGQGKLFPAYDRLLEERGLIAAQVLLTAMDMHDRARYLNARQTLAKLLEWGVVPVVNENDTTATDEISFGDNDFLAAQVATLVGADMLVLLTDVEGLFTADPRTDPAASLVREVTDFSALEQLSLGAATSPWGTGGMPRKLIAAEIATAAGTTTVVCSGLDAGALPAVLRREARGTRFPARERGHSSFKLWLKHAKPARGRVVIDAGAARALRERGGSLLPVGVVAVHGDFQVGDAIDIYEAAADGARDAAPAPLAKGISRLSAAELDLVKGLSSAQVRARLPEADEEAVHRDHLVVG